MVNLLNFLFKDDDLITEIIYNWYAVSDILSAFILLKIYYLRL